MNILKPMARGSEEIMENIISLSKKGKNYIMEKENEFYWIGEKIGSVKITAEELSLIGGSKNLEPSNMSRELKVRLVKSAKDAQKAKRNRAFKNAY